MTTLTERIDKLPTERRRKVERRANTLIAEEMSLRDLREERPKNPGTNAWDDELACND